jgi:hypothetical protein
VRSRARKGRSPATAGIYRKSYEAFWTWAEAEGLDPNPDKITSTTVNQCVDALLASPVVRNGEVQYDSDSVTGERHPRPVAANTVRIRWQNLRPFFSWWAAEMEKPNPSTAPTRRSSMTRRSRSRASTRCNSCCGRATAPTSMPDATPR